MHTHMYTHTHTHTHTHHYGILFSHKKNEILIFVTTQIGLEVVMLSEMSKIDKYGMILLLCGV